MPIICAVNREYLQAYEAEEFEKYRNYIHGIEDSVAPQEIPYPDTRISNAISPIVIADTDVFAFDKEKLWNQIPFAGTLLVPLRVSSKENLLYKNGFDEKDIPDLLKMAKETRKLLFCIPTDSRLYEGLDHLDPIFQEARPMKLWSIPVSQFRTGLEISKIHAEFHEKSKLKYSPMIMKDAYFETSNASRYFLRMNRDTYTNLKILGFDDSADLILEKMIHDPPYAARLLMACGVAVDPIFLSIGAHDNRSLRKLEQMKIVKHHAEINSEFDKLPRTLSTGSRPEFPIEIGRYLIKKLALNPSDYVGCRLAIDKYDNGGLYRILKSIDKGIRDRSYSTEADIKELDTIMDQIWEDAMRMKTSAKVIKGGLRIVMGIAGLGLASTLGTPGLMATIGFSVLEEIMQTRDIGEKVAKLINKDYVVNIYEFSQKSAN